MPMQTINTVQVDTLNTQQVNVPTVIRHEEQAVFSSSSAGAAVFTHQEAPIVKTIVE